MKTITSEQEQMFMEILIRMGYSKREIFDLCHLVEIPEALQRVLSVMEQRDYEILPEELLEIAQQIEAEVIEELPDEG